jgi:hypothetical protein
MRSAERGLTLLEVLGAVALLGILYATLARGAIEGLRSEGESRRRLEASLLADDRLVEIELAAAEGTVPPIGSAEDEVEDFRVSTEVRAYELPPPVEDASAGPTSLAAKRAAARSQDAPSLFAPPRSPDAPAAVLGVEVVVRWTEGIDEREVRRTTFVVDESAVEERFAELGQRPDHAEPEDEGTEGSTGEGDRVGERPKDQPLPQFDFPRPGPEEEEEP